MIAQDRWRLHLADITQKINFPLVSNQADAIVTDPPYEIDIHGLEWDGSGVAFDVRTWRRVFEVAKPGAYMVAFGSPRRCHRMICAVEDAGWEIMDTIFWLHAQGFPRVQTVLKPAQETIVLARKPAKGRSLKQNLGERGVGALQIERCRVNGLWPANVMVDETAKALLPKSEYGDLRRFLFVSKPSTAERDLGCDALPMSKKHVVMKDKDASVGRNFHPTVKPVDLMEWLCRLVTPPRGLVYDPFTGSGTTGVAALRMGFRFVGTEKNKEYIPIARARMSRAAVSKEARVNW
jgi:site-specific DNA-methyltransferase (adenine-specific)